MFSAYMYTLSLAHDTSDDSFAGDVVNACLQSFASKAKLYKESKYGCLRPGCETEHDVNTVNLKLPSWQFSCC